MTRFWHSLIQFGAGTLLIAPGIILMIFVMDRIADATDRWREATIKAACIIVGLVVIGLYSATLSALVPIGWLS